MDEYIIKFGHHNFKPNKIKFFTKNNLVIKGYFDKSCLYDFNDIDDYDINKLAGFSTSIHHEVQSARVGWRPSRLIPGNIDLLTYVHDNNSIIDTLLNVIFGNPIERKDDRFIMSVAPDEIFKINLIATDNAYIFLAENKKNTSEIKIEISKKKRKFPFKYLLTPYFGGNKKAPKKMKLYLDKL